MKNLQKKSLEHVQELLESYETYTTYSCLNNILEKLEIEREAKQKILNIYQEEIAKQTRKVEEANTWIETIISDIS